MFRIPSLNVGKLVKYGIMAFASQHLMRKGYRRYTSNRERQSPLSNNTRNPVDTASQDSFPASDPPSYTGSTVGPLR